MLSKDNTSIVSVLKKHILIVFYLATTSLLAVGLVNYTGFKHIDKILIFFAALIPAYIGINYLFKRRNIYSSLGKISIPVSGDRLKKIAYAFSIGVCLFTFYHYYFLGHVPVISAYISTDYYKIALIRQSIIEHDNTLLLYMSSIIVRAIMPFLLFYFYQVNRKFFYLLTAVFILYCLALMQKAFIVNLFIPLIVYCLLTRRFKDFIVFTLIPLLGIFFLVFTTNPALRERPENIQNSQPTDRPASISKNINDAGDAIYERVFFTTGKVVGYWFNMIPSELPYANGCGYRLLAPMLGCDYNDYDYTHIIYNKVYVHESSLGLKGTVTVASFVYDWANFGNLGLILAGIIHALLFCFINGIMEFNFVYNVSFNFLPVLWLSSVALTTTLLSGGWFFMILMYLAFRNNLAK